MIKNKLEEEKSTYKIYLTNRKKEVVGIAIVDKGDEVLEHTWYLNNSGYAITRINKNKQVLMHRMIMGDKDKMDIDHINRNKLDNRRSNLRFVTRSQNMMNTDSKGYYWCNNKKKWSAYIHINYRSIALGRFDKESDAKKAREKAEVKYFGKFKTICS